MGLLGSGWYETCGTGNRRCQTNGRAVVTRRALVALSSGSELVLGGVGTNQTRFQSDPVPGGQ